MAFLTDLATNASNHGVAVLIYSGNDDSLVSHISSESKHLYHFSNFPLLTSRESLSVVIQAS